MTTVPEYFFRSAKPTLRSVTYKTCSLQSLPETPEHIAPEYIAPMRRLLRGKDNRRHEKSGWILRELQQCGELDKCKCKKAFKIRILSDYECQLSYVQVMYKYSSRWG